MRPRPTHKPLYDTPLTLPLGWRMWLLALAFVVSGLSIHAAAPGFYVSGELSATDTEREEGMVALGQDVVLIVRDQAVYNRQIAPLIGKTVRLVLVSQ